MFSRYSSVVLALGGLVAAIPYDGPVATPVAKKFAADGWTPKPTSAPILELFRRQEDPSFCGYLNGDPENPIQCSIGSCMYNKAYSWFGCCTGTKVSDCDIQTACVESASYSRCLSDSSCANDQLATACLKSSRPYCVGLYTVITGETYGHFACGATDTTYEVVSTTSGASLGGLSSSRKSASLLTDESSSRSSRSRAQSSTTEDSSDSTTESSASESSSPPSFSFSFVDGTTTGSVNAASVTPNTTPTTTAASTGGAMRTAEVALGAVGGVAGLLFMFA
ncbi:hypothetical protein BCR34DRAFT_614393 [Clohesyomyces aquaticus]|uniref:Extracellular membrane protein CFEM domain-containing protein n=1 Tax=Clohesyomyces aquaticus TaxID=1231657 RepID=A0A1Y1ZNL6_9PLEO|nr:hypothetical protein BCR34DRAFT_614393 [Clohesyomyces aquaticus]